MQRDHRNRPAGGSADTHEADVLSDAIVAVRTGRPHSIRHELFARWGMHFPSGEGAGFHVVLRGSCWLIPAEGPPIALKAGISVDIADAIADGRRPTAMSVDEEIVYDFTIELQRNKRVSDATFNRAEQRFGKKGVVDMTAISGYYTSLAMQLNAARYQFAGEGPRLSRFPD